MATVTFVTPMPSWHTKKKFCQILLFVSQTACKRKCSPAEVLLQMRCADRLEPTEAELTEDQTGASSLLVTALWPLACRSFPS